MRTIVRATICVVGFRYAHWWVHWLMMTSR